MTRWSHGSYDVAVGRDLDFDPGVIVFLNSGPEQVTGVPPGIKHNPLVESLFARCQHDRAMLATGAETRNPAVQFQRTQLKCCKFTGQIVGPLETQSALPDPEVNQHIVENRGADHPIFLG
jgi:hypothetical protein